MTGGAPVVRLNLTERQWELLAEVVDRQHTYEIDLHGDEGGEIGAEVARIGELRALLIEARAAAGGHPS